MTNCIKCQRKIPSGSFCADCDYYGRLVSNLARNHFSFVMANDFEEAVREFADGTGAIRRCDLRALVSSTSACLELGFDIKSKIDRVFFELMIGVVFEAIAIAEIPPGVERSHILRHFSLLEIPNPPMEVLPERRSGPIEECLSSGMAAASKSVFPSSAEQGVQVSRPGPEKLPLCDFQSGLLFCALPYNHAGEWHQTIEGLDFQGSDL